MHFYDNEFSFSAIMMNGNSTEYGPVPVAAQSKS